MPYSIREEKASRKYMTQLPNLVIDNDVFDLSIYAHWLYVHFKRVAGENGVCWKSVKTLAEESGMSVGSVTKAKKELEENGLIRIDKVENKDGGRKKHEIIIVDIWAKNISHYSEKYEDRSSPHELASSPHELNKIPIKKGGEGKEQPSRDNSSAPPPDKKKKSKGRDSRLDHHAIQTFRETMRFHAQIAWRDDIIETVGDQEDEWRAHLKDWIGRGYNPRNIKDILRTFREGGISRKPPQPEVPKGYSPA